MDRWEWAGSLTGLAGAGLLALNLPAISGYGFIAFLASNICWIVVGRQRRMIPLLLMQLGFTATSLLGLYRWLI